MDPMVLFTILFTLMYLIIYAVVTFVLYRRYKKTKLANLKYLVAAFLIFTLSTVLQLMRFTEITVILYTLGYLSLIPFSQQTFQRIKRNTYSLSLIVSGILFVVVSGLVFYRLTLVSEDPFLFYITYIASGTIQAISALILIYSSFKEYSSMKTLDIEQWTLSRYKLVGTTGIVLMISAYVPMIMTPGAGFTVINNVIALTIVSTTQFFFSLTSYLSWVMPDFFKRFLNRNYESSYDIEISEDQAEKILSEEIEVPEELREPEVPVKRLLRKDVIPLFGDMLGDKLGRNPLAARGTIRFAIQDEYGKEGIKSLTPEQFKFVLKGSLTIRLQRLKVDEALINKAISEIVNEVDSYRSLFTMTYM